MTKRDQLTTAYGALVAALKADPGSPPADDLKAAVLDAYNEYEDGRKANSDLIDLAGTFMASDDFEVASAGAVAKAQFDAYRRANKGSKATDPTPNFGTPEGDEVIGNRMALLGALLEQLFEKVSEQSDLRTTDLLDAIEIISSVGDPDGGDLYLPAATTKGDWAADPKAGSGSRSTIERDEESVPEGDYPLVGSDSDKTNGTMRSDGKGNLTFLVGDSEYSSPSAAAKAVTGSQTNGWTFWQLDGRDLTDHFGPEYAGPDPDESSA